MKAKKKLKKKSEKRKIVKANTLTANVSLVGKLKKSSMPITRIAKELGYKSHNTVRHWFLTGKVPAHKVDAINKLLRSK